MSTFTRRQFLASTAMAAALAPAGDTAGAGGIAGSRPNIVLILTDDQGYGDFSCHGNPVLKTPAMDRMHAESVCFNDFHVSPTCAPTRTSIMTGMHEFYSGVTHTIFERERMSLKRRVLPEALRDAGYRTGIFGKWHLGDEDAYQPERRGFDEVFIHGGGGIGQHYPGTCGDAPGNHYQDPVILHNGVFEATKGYCTDVFFSQALRWIDGQRSKNAPFFAYIPTNAPHTPLDCPEEYVAPYRGKVSEDEAKYFGMLANMDMNLDRFLSQLREWQLDRDTLVVYLTDNGGISGTKVFNAGMRGAKCSPFQGGTRAAAFFWWPDTLAPGETSALSAHIDLFPTFAALADAKCPDVQGHSLLPQLEDPAAPGDEDRMLFTHVGRWATGADPRESKYAGCAVRWRNYRMVSAAYRARQGAFEQKPFEGDRPWVLYDLAEDPGEAHDVAEKFPKVLARLDAAYDAWWDSLLPHLENEGAYATAPAENPFWTRYWAQYQGPGPNGVEPPEK